MKDLDQIYYQTEMRRMRSIVDTYVIENKQLKDKNDELRQKLTDAQKALDGEIALSEFRRNQLVQLNTESELYKQKFERSESALREAREQKANCSIDVTPEMLTAAQKNSKLGGYACANFSGGYSAITELFKVMCEAYSASAAPKPEGEQ